MNTNTTETKETNAAKQEAGEGWMGRLVRFLFGATATEEKRDKSPEETLADCLRDDPGLKEEITRRHEQYLAERVEALRTLKEKSNEELMMMSLQWILHKTLPNNEPASMIVQVLDERIHQTNEKSPSVGATEKDHE